MSINRSNARLLSTNEQCLASAQMRQLGQALVCARTSSAHRRWLGLPKRQQQRRYSLQLVLCPHFSLHPLRLGHDLSVPHPYATRLEDPRSLPGRPSLENVDVAMGRLLGSIVVHHPHHRRVLPRCLAFRHAHECDTLLLDVCLSYCDLGGFRLREDLLWSQNGVEME